jgi:hypothetical protein
VSDTETGQVAFLGTMREVNTPMPNPVIIAVRLKIENRQVSEIENIVVRRQPGGDELWKRSAVLTGVPGGDPGGAESFARDLISHRQRYLSALKRMTAKSIPLR